MIFFECFSRKLKFSTEILMEEIKPVVMQLV